MKHLLDSGGQSPGKASQTLDYSIYSFPQWLFKHFAHWRFISRFQQERHVVLFCRTPWTPVGDAAYSDSLLRFAWSVFAKKNPVSYSKEAANRWDVLCHLAFPLQPPARACFAVSMGGIPACLLVGCLYKELVALVQQVLLLLHYGEMKPGEKHVYWAII